MFKGMNLSSKKVTKKQNKADKSKKTKKNPREEPKGKLVVSESFQERFDELQIEGSTRYQLEKTKNLEGF